MKHVLVNLAIIIPITETISRLFNLEIHKRNSFELILIMSFIYSLAIFKRFYNFLIEIHCRCNETNTKFEIIANKIFCFAFSSIMTLFISFLLNLIISISIDMFIKIYYFFRFQFQISIIGIKIAILIIVIYLIIKGLDKIRRNIEEN